MKAAPFFVAGLTASAALAAGALLAAEDRALFEPQHAMLVSLADDVPGSSVARDVPHRAAAPTGVRPRGKP